MPTVRGRVARVGGLCLLLLGAAWGTQARADLSWGRLHLGEVVQVAALAAVCVVVVAVALRLLGGGFHRRSHEGEHRERVVQMPMTRWERVQLVVAAVLAAAAAVVVVWLLSTHVGGAQAPEVRRAVHRPAAHAARSARGQHPSAIMSHVGLLALIVVILVVIGVMALILVQRRVAMRGRMVRLGGVPEYARRTNAGRATGEFGRDPRGAVIAAYRSFEQEAARRGISVEPPETAQDIGRGTIGTTLASPVEVHELTALFHRARYSSAPVREQDRTEALRLLRELRSQMRSSS